MSSETDNKALLQQLRIDRSAPRAAERPQRRSWIVGAALASWLLAALRLVALVRPAALPCMPAARAMQRRRRRERLGARCHRLRDRAARGDGVGADHRHADRRC